MRIELENIGQRFNYDQIFRGITTEFKLGDRCAVVGSNGSGKSTLLKIISGKSIPSEGEIRFYAASRSEPTDVDKVYKEVSLCAPYMSVYEQFTLEELLKFHFRFCRPQPGISLNKIPEMLQLEKHKNRVIENYSSGMKQRIKLGLAVLSQTSVLLLDEPFSNLDQKGIEHMKNLIKQHLENRILVVCTNNHGEELNLCDRKLNVEDYK